MEGNKAAVEPENVYSVMRVGGNQREMMTPAESPRQFGLGRDSTQIRIRLRPEERFTYERLRLEAWQAGDLDAETLSSWVRSKLKSLTRPRADQEPCQIPKELYDLISELAERLGIEPETFVEACIDAIIDMADHPKRKLPPLISKCRSVGTAPTKKPI